MDRYLFKGTRKIDHAFNEQTGLSLYDRLIIIYFLMFKANYF
jgi:hypothetical protein